MIYPYNAILHDARRGAWKCFRDPHEVVEAYVPGEVIHCLKYLESCVGDSGLHAAGFISYEAAPAFDERAS